MALNYVYSDFDMELNRQTDGDIQIDVDIEAIKNSIINIITTKKGSRRMLPNFGVDIDRYLFEPLDRITARKIGNELLSEILRWEPRAIIDNINVAADVNNSMYSIDIYYTISDISNIVSSRISFILRHI